MARKQDFVSDLSRVFMQDVGWKQTDKTYASARDSHLSNLLDPGTRWEVGCPVRLHVTCQNPVAVSDILTHAFHPPFESPF